ncbi:MULTISPECIES: oxygen-independent coproporphyrinogen III oxidase [Pseudomonadaceae]|uniref:oxygen-independent coproporphyrinogen III oxidase n=1 Tax=Pseudomonadaceae TaxID=135621 RepID=UPI0015E31AEE|nr:MULTISPECIES: oxygen-independent coproporphyrinogen III oxidase [Pseudomonadaceae]MBA1278346.1 oxygen-independent coproporphyrinogen III oxidase [Stutzerimonas stutzeri]MBC8648439.1 oxygen-independent coproporphyrinogen III oxidase [Pseudomonas sp. MT4]QXY94042.1 oxygen-independent coproporphyrinogen III oxidase [Pseudomonas sp. MTM4]
MLDAIRWDADLIHRYGQAGPSYPSYHAALQFSGGLSSFDLLHALRRSRQASRPLSLYIHLPFCATACYYCHRNKVITSDRSRIQSYLQRLEQEIEMIACHLAPHQMVEQLHIGGGTPNLLSHDDLRRLMTHLRKHFNLQNDDHADFSIEIDPREADWPTMGLLRELGFNRISVGLQALDPDVQRAINRPQTIEQTQTIIEAARTLQYRSLHMDLVYGLPLQTHGRFARTVEAVLALQPDRISVSNYVHLPERHMAQRRISATDLPTSNDQLAMLQHSVEQLTRSGYRYIGMDQFALPDDELAMAQEDGTLQHNVQGYTTHGHCDLIGLGVSAISQIGDLYCQNHSDITLYQQMLDQGQLATIRGLRCSEDDRIRSRVIEALICNFELRFDEIESAHGIVFKIYFKDSWPTLEQMAADGLIQLKADTITILPAGRLLASSVCMQFDNRPPRPARLFSRAI